MSKLDILYDRVKKILEQEEKTPFTVSIMGQTGVGKSSLINALFGTKLDVSATSPGTEKIEEIYITGSLGHKLLFYDIPGIGSSKRADEKYLAEYEQKLIESDVILWAILCDSRSFSYDLDALDILFASITKLSRTEILSKMIFVLTKVDILIPPPWILAKTGEMGVFVPQADTVSLLKEKEEFVQRNFILPYKDSLISQTYFKEPFKIDDEKFEYENNEIRYKGVLTWEELESLKKRFPSNQETLERLYDNYRVVPCSSRFQFNLDLLTRLIITKLGTGAIARFSNLYTDKNLYTIPLSEAKNLSNIVVVDRSEKKVVFDLASTEI